MVLSPDVVIRHRFIRRDQPGAYSSDAKFRCCSLVRAMVRRPFARIVFGLYFGLLPMTIHGAKPFEFSSTPGKLPKQVVPNEYAIRIVPNLEAKTFPGTVLIKVRVNEPVHQLVMNALELHVTEAVVDEKAVPSSAIKLDRKQ